MNRYDLITGNGQILRILEIESERMLLIDCIRQTMPVWVEASLLGDYKKCTADALFEATDWQPISPDRLTAEQKQCMHERYTQIVPILPVLADKRKRSEGIAASAEENGATKTTIRHYLCRYLAYMDITALAPVEKQHRERALTPDEKNMRWALNRFFYSSQKQSLRTAYTMMLSAKYCDEMGVLTENHPSYYQFRYFYRKTRKLQNYYISRDGLTQYQRNKRPLLGDGVQAFASAVGTGMLDATVCDIYLVNESGQLVGRPNLTVCVDAYSGLCCGYVLTWEGGTYSLRELIQHVVTDKVAWCQRFGISIQQSEWPCDKLPGVLVTDMGKEYTSGAFEQISELGIKIVNLPAYRPELKGAVEKFFDVIQNLYKKHLKGKGVVEPDYQERGVHDYRRDACLTMRDFETILLHCIIYYNSQRTLEKFPYTQEMLRQKIPPHSNSIWNWGITQMGANLIDVAPQALRQTMLPRALGKFGRHGLTVNKLRYHCEGYTEQYLKGGEVVVSYDPDDVSCVWVVEQGEYTRFDLIPSRYKGKTLTDVGEMQTAQRDLMKTEETSQIQAEIDLARHIQTIANNALHTSATGIKNIRATRNVEKQRKRNQ